MGHIHPKFSHHQLSCLFACRFSMANLGQEFTVYEVCGELLSNELNDLPPRQIWIVSAVCMTVGTVCGIFN